MLYLLAGIDFIVLVPATLKAQFGCGRAVSLSSAVGSVWVFLRNVSLAMCSHAFLNSPV